MPDGKDKKSIQPGELPSDYIRRLAAESAAEPDTAPIYTLQTQGQEVPTAQEPNQFMQVANAYLHGTAKKVADFERRLDARAKAMYPGVSPEALDFYKQADRDAFRKQMMQGFNQAYASTERRRVQNLPAVQVNTSRWKRDKDLPEDSYPGDTRSSDIAAARDVADAQKQIVKTVQSDPEWFKEHSDPNYRNHLLNLDNYKDQIAQTRLIKETPDAPYSIRYGGHYTPEDVALLDRRASKKEDTAPVDMDEALDANGNIRPDFLYRLNQAAGGDVGKMREMFADYMHGKQVEYNSNPLSIAQAEQQDLADRLHNHKLAYYGLRLQQGIGQGLGVTYALLRGLGGELTGGDFSHDYVQTLQREMRRYPDTPARTESQDWYNLDHVLSMGAHMTGEFLPSLFGGEGGTPALIAERLGTGYGSRLLANSLHMAKTATPQIFAGYVEDGLAKGYSEAEAINRAVERTPLSILAMSVPGAFVKGAPGMDKAAKGILNGADEATGTKLLLQKAGQAAQKYVAPALAGGASFAAGSLADSYLNHVEDVQKFRAAQERGEIPADAAPPQFDYKTALKDAGEQGGLGLIWSTIERIKTAPGEIAPPSQAKYIYDAVADPQGFDAAVARGVRRNTFTPEQGAQLVAFRERVTPYVAQATADGYRPHIAAQIGVEYARMDEAAQTAIDLSKQLATKRVTAHDGSISEVPLAPDERVGAYTEEAGRAMLRQIDDLKASAESSAKTIQQLKEGSYVRGRTVGGEELLQLTGNFTPKEGLTPEQAKGILAHAPYVAETRDISGYADDAQVKNYLKEIKDGKLSVDVKHANDPIIASDGSIIDGEKRIALALSQGKGQMEILRPKSTPEIVRSAQESYDQTLGAVEPVKEGTPNAGVVQQARDIYEQALDREATPEEIDAGLTTPAVRAIADAAQVIHDAGLPMEQAREALREVHPSIAPDAAEHFLNVAAGSKPAESVFDKEAPKVEAAPAEEALPQPTPEQEREALSKIYGEDPIITESPLWDKEAGAPKEGVTREDIRDYYLDGTLPEGMAAPAEQAAEGAVPEAEVNAAPQELAAEPTKTTVDYTTQTSNRVFTDEKGILHVVNKDGNPVSDNTRRKAILEAAQSHDFTKGEDAPIPEDAASWNDRRIEQHVAETSNNSAELATLWLHSEREQTPLSSAESAIVDFGGFTTTTQSFDRFGDRNNRTITIAKTYLNDGSKDGSINRKRGAGLDQIADEISGHTGIEVTPQDLVDFMLRFPSGVSQAERTFLSEAAQQAAKRFKEITGFELHERVPLSKKIAEIALAQQKAKYNEAEKEFLQHEYESAEQERQDYEQALAEGLFEPTGQGDNLRPRSPDVQNAQGQAEAAGSSPEGEGRDGSAARTDELPAGRGGQRADSPAGEQAPIVRARANIWVPTERLKSLGWTRKSVQAFAGRIKESFGRDKAIVILDGEAARRLTGRYPDAWYEDGVIYLNVDGKGFGGKGIRPSTLLHEAGHLWRAWAEVEAPELHAKGIELAKQSNAFRFANGEISAEESGLTSEQQKRWEQYKRAYTSHSNPELALADEVLAHAIQESGKAFAGEKDLKSQFGKWLQSFWDAAKKAMGFKDLTPRQFAELSFKDFADRVAAEIGQGKELTRRIEEEKQKLSKSKAALRAEKQQARQDDAVMDDMLDAVGAKKANAGFEGFTIEQASEKDEPVTDDAVINAIGRGGGYEMAEMIHRKAPAIYRKMLEAAGSEAALQTGLENPLAAPKEIQEALGFKRKKRRGGDVELQPGLLYDALAALSKTYGGTPSPTEIVHGLARYHAEVARRIQAHEEAVRRGRENQQAGEEKKRGGQAEGKFVTALTKAMQDGKIRYQRDIDDLAKKHGIAPERMADLVEDATNKAYGEQLYSLPEEYSPRDERETYFNTLKDAAEERTADKFHEEALPAIRSAYQNGVIDRGTALDLHRRVTEAVGSAEKVKAFVDYAKGIMLPEGDRDALYIGEPLAAEKENIKTERFATALKHAVADEELANMGKERLQRPAHTDAARWTDTEKLFAKNPLVGRELIEAHADHKPFNPTAQEAFIMAYETKRLQNAIADVEEAKIKADNEGDSEASVKYVQQLTNLNRQLDETYDVNSLAGSEAGEAFRVRQLFVQPDYSLAAIERKAQAAKGSPLTDAERSELDKLRKDAIEKEKGITAHEKVQAKKDEQKREGIAKKTAEQKWEQTRRKGRKTGKTQSLDSILDRYRAKFNVPPRKDAMFHLPETNAEGDDITSDVHNLIADTYRFYAETEPSLSIEAATAKVKESLAEFLPDATEQEIRDNYTGYGKIRKPNSDPIDALEREWKEQGRLVSTLERALGGQAGLRSGYQRGEKSERVRELMAQIRAAAAQHGIVMTDPEKQLKTALATAIRQTEIEIATTEKEIRTGQRRPDSQNALVPNERLIALRAQRDFLHNQRDELLGKKPISDERRIALAEKVLERSIASKEQKIKSGNITPDARERKGPETEHIKELRKRSEELTRIISEMRKAQHPSKSPEEKATEAAIKRKQKELDEINRQIKESDLEREQKQSLVDKENEHIKALDDALSKAREARKTLKGDLGITDREALAQWKKTVQRNLDKVNERMAKEQWETTPKTERALDEEGRRLSAEYKAARQRLNDGIARFRYQNKKGYEKFFDAAKRVQLAEKISGLYVLPKIIMMDVTSTVTRPVEDVYGHTVGRLPVIGAGKGIWAKAHGEGRVHFGKEATAYAEGLVQGIKDFPKTFMGKGGSELKAIYDERGKSYQPPIPVVDHIMHLHEALKNPLYEAAFRQSVTRRTENLIQEGKVDITDPVVKSKIMNEGNQAGLRAIYANENWYSRLVQRVARTIEYNNKTGKDSSFGQKLGGFLFATLLPVNRVPSNIIIDIANKLGAGSIVGRAKILNAYGKEFFSAKDISFMERLTTSMQKAVDKMTPEEADTIVRLMKKGDVGLLFSVMGLLLYSAIGNKRVTDAEEGEVHEDEIQMFGMNVPKWLLENTNIQAMQYAATARRVFEHYTEGNGYDAPTAAMVAGLKAFTGIAREVPFMNAAGRINEALGARGVDKITNSPLPLIGSQWWKSNIIPAAVQDVAKMTDKDEEGFAQGHTIQRVPEKASRVGYFAHLWQQIKTGIPGLRQQVNEHR